MNSLTLVKSEALASVGQSGLSVANVSPLQCLSSSTNADQNENFCDCAG